MAHVIEKLNQDHERVEQIFAKLQESGAGARKTREKLCQQLIQELKAHTRFEERVFYPAVRESGDGAGQIVRHAIDEHRQVERMLLRLEKMDVTSTEFMELLGEIQESVQKHVREEEDEIFPLAEKSIEDQDAVEMAVRHDKMVRDFRQHASR